MVIKLPENEAKLEEARIQGKNSRLIKVISLPLIFMEPRGFEPLTS